MSLGSRRVFSRRACADTASIGSSTRKSSPASRGASLPSEAASPNPSTSPARACASRQRPETRVFRPNFLGHDSVIETARVKSSPHNSPETLTATSHRPLARPVRSPCTRQRGREETKDEGRMRPIKLAVVCMIGAALAAIGAAAQPADKVYRIGMLERTAATINTANVEAFRQGLRALGYVEGKNLVIEYRSADGRDERFRDLAAELVAQKVDLIL